MFNDNNKKTMIIKIIGFYNYFIGNHNSYFHGGHHDLISLSFEMACSLSVRETRGV